MSIKSIDCSDLYDNAAEKQKRLDNDIDETVRGLAKRVEARGVPKNKVARQVVKELTAREVLCPSRIYEGLGIEQKRKYQKRVTEETFPRAENISTEESSTNRRAAQIAVTSTGQFETRQYVNGELDIKLVFEEQNQLGLRQEDEGLKKEKGKSEPIKEITYLREENGSLKSIIEGLEKQLAQKNTAKKKKI
jgi:hypothetical protein